MATHAARRLLEPVIAAANDMVRSGAVVAAVGEAALPAIGIP